MIEGGRLGIASLGPLNPRDAIWVVFGSTLLLILYEGHDGSHNLKGLVPVEGFMEGEPCADISKDEYSIQDIVAYIFVTFFCGEKDSKSGSQNQSFLSSYC